MTTSPKLTPHAQIEYLATKVMGWQAYSDDIVENMKVIRPLAWNPLTDWNHFRQVEEKVMEDEQLFNVYRIELEKSFGGIIAADLPTRISALIAAHQSLTQTKDGK